MTVKSEAIEVAAKQAEYQMYHGIIPPQSSSNGWVMTTTGDDTDTEGDEVARIIRKHSKGYYYVMTVDDGDNVHYQVYEGGFLKKALFKLMGEHPHATFIPLSGGNSTCWTPIRKRTHLPATIGAAHVAIDNDIADWKEEKEHGEYAEEMLKTHPDNLKMIEGLEKLQEGDDDDDGQTTAYAANVSAAPVPTIAVTSKTATQNAIDQFMWESGRDAIEAVAAELQKDAQAK